MKIKKLIIIATLFLCCCLIGCGKKETKYIDGFEVAEYDKFNSYASENGLGGTLICIEGKVLNQTLLKADSDIPQLMLIVEQNDSKRWCVSLISETEIKKIQDKNVRIFGTYLGYSDVANLPGIAVAVNDENIIKKSRIEIENNGEYEEVYNFYEDCAKQQIEKLDSETEVSNVDTIDTFQWDYDEDNKLTIGLFKDETKAKENISVLGSFTAENFGLMYDSYILIFALSYSCGIDVNIMCQVEEDSYMLSMNDGKILSNTFPQDSKDIPDVPESYLDSLKEMQTALDEFYVKNGLKEKSYNQLVYEDENVKIYFTGIDDSGVNFNVENLTDKQVTIQADSIAINGKSTNSIIMSDDVAPNSTGKVVAKCDDFYSKTEIEKISGVLRVIGIKDVGYDATFTDITME